MAGRCRVAETPWLWCWRHPRAIGAAGRCIGRTDVPVDPRKAKRLAHRMRRVAREHGLPREVWVSPLQRAGAVGRWLRRWGWQLQVDARLAEMDFGGWDGRRWADIPWAEVGAWEADLLHHAPGGGEALQALALRVQGWVNEAVTAGVPRQIVSHGGWINSLLHLPRLLPHEQTGNPALAAVDWPAAPPHSSLRCWPGGAAAGR